MQPLYGALAGLYVPVRVTRGALVAHRYTYELPRCRTSQYRRTIIPLSVSLWKNLLTLNLMVCDWQVSSVGPLSVYWPKMLAPFCLIIFSLSLLSFYGLVLWGRGHRTDMVLIALSQPCIAPIFYNNYSNNNEVQEYVNDFYAKKILIFSPPNYIFLCKTLVLKFKNLLIDSNNKILI